MGIHWITVKRIVVIVLVCMCVCVRGCVCDNYFDVQKCTHTYKTMVIHTILIIIITKHLLRQYPRNESNSVVPLIQGLGRLIVWVQCKVDQQMIKWSGNLGRIKQSPVNEHW